MFSILALITGIGLGVSCIALVDTFSLPWLISTLVCLTLLMLAVSGIRRLQNRSLGPDKITSRLVLIAIAAGALIVPAVGFMLLFHK